MINNFPRHRRRSPPLRNVPALLLLCQACVVLGSVSCAGDPTLPAERTFPSDPTPPLEPVAFEVIGSGKVMFQRIGDLDRGGTFHAVYLIDADARQTSTVLDTVSSFIVWGTSISPAGDEVAWRRWNPEGCYSVYTTDLTGGRPRRLSFFSCNSEDDPSWTPLGSAVVFPVGASAAFGIYQRVLTTDTLITLRTFSAEPDAFRRCFRFGPAAVSAREALAYACFQEIYGAENPNDPLTVLYRTTSSDAQVYFPAWSPNGTDLAFLELLRDTMSFSWGRGAILSTSLKVLDLGGGMVRTVAVVPGSGGPQWLGADNPVSLCWLPGGTNFVFSAPSTGVVAGKEPLRANLYVVGADSTGLVRLTTAPDAFDYNVSCSR